MPEQITNYQCPACTGPLHFSASSGKLECEYCGSSFDVKDIEEMYSDKEAEAAENAANANAKDDRWNFEASNSDWGEDAQKMRAYSCPSCGAQIICDETTAATSCPYCSNPTIVPGQFSGTLRPDYVIPFKFEKKAAMQSLRQHYKGKLLLPKSFKDENHIESIKGVYVPFWLFDGEVDGHATYHATNTLTHREGDYKVIDTSHFTIQRTGSIAFDKVPVDGSSKMPDDYMDSIEPFDYSDLRKFSTAYLPGYLADKYDVDASQASERADIRCKNTAVESFRNSVVGYQTVAARSQNFRLKHGQVKYALLPVWMLNTKWNGKDYLFAMNGQTGRMVGDLPVDKKKAHLWFWSTAICSSVVISLLFSETIGKMLFNLLS